MTTYLGKSCSFCLPRVPFVNCRQFMYLVISLFDLRAGYGILLYQFLIIAYLFTFYWNRLGKTALPQASMSTIYKQYLYNMTPYTLNYGPDLGKTLFPVLGDNRTLRMRQPDH